MYRKIEPGDYLIQVPKDHVHAHPPPQNAYLSRYYSRRARRHRNLRLCCCLSLLVPLLLLLLLSLFFRPRPPRFSVDALSVRAFYPQPAEIRVHLRAENPNGKMGIRYGMGGSVEVYYRGVRMCGGGSPAFYQGAGNATVVGVDLRGDKLRMGEEGGEAAEEMVVVEVRVTARGEIGVVRTWEGRLRARCEVRVDAMSATARVMSQACGVRFR